MEGGDGERQAGGLVGLYSWPCGFLFLGTILLMGLKKAVALSRGLLYFSALKRILYVITSRERGTAVSVQWHYLFEALAFVEEEKIATCFLKKDVSGVI